jgi:hypothetical protein
MLRDNSTSTDDTIDWREALDDDLVSTVIPDINRRDFVKASSAMAVLGAFGSSPVGARESGDEYYKKTRPTVFTEEERRNAFENIERYDWAADQRDAAVSHADAIIDAWDFETLWRLVPSQNIPRSFLLTLGTSYVTTTDWSYDVIDGAGSVYGTAPTFNWEITNTFEINGEIREITIPTNDFAAYRESGRDEAGMFDPALADDSLLVNTKHPDLGEDWGIDDGTGFIDREGYLTNEVQTTTLATNSGNERDEVDSENPKVDSGMFEPALPHDPLRINTNPTGQVENQVVNRGFVDSQASLVSSEGTWWNPIAWLNHWAVIYGMRHLCVELSEAYLYTGDEKYLTPAAVILDRVGDVYPDLSILQMYQDFEHVAADEFEYGAFYNSTGGTQQGKFVGSIWESYQIREQLRNYDKIFPGMDGNTDLIHTLSAKKKEYPGIGDKGSIGAIRENIEEGFIHEILPAFEHAQIRGNFGSHHQTLAVSAVCADEPDGYTGNAIDYAFQPGTLLPPSESPTGRWYITGGDILGFLVGSPQSGYMVDEQGYPNESAVHYNGLQQRALEGVAHELDGYNAYAGADLYQNPKFMSAINSQWQLTFGPYLPHIANTIGVGEPESVLEGFDYEMSADFALTGFDKYGTTELAQWAYMLSGLSTDSLDRGIFHPNPVGIKDEVQAVVNEHGPVLDLDSNQQAAYGFSALRDGEYDPNGESTYRGIYQYYGRNYWNYAKGNSVGSSHIHFDTHNLGVYGYGLDLAPELGREGSDWEGNDLSNWVDSTPAHNTVTVDEENINHPQWVGYPRHFDHTDRVQLMDVESQYAYEQTDEHRRTTAMINVDDEASYGVDFFRVVGGNDHHFSFHGMTSVDVAVEGLDLTVQERGTYADPDVEFTEGGPFSYLYDVERDDDPGTGFSVDWDIEDYWDVRDDGGEPVHLRLTMLNDVDDVALATGRPAFQEEGQPRELRFMLAHRSGSDLQSTFTSVIEPYEGDRFITDISEVPIVSTDDTARAVRVELKNGRTDYIAVATDPKPGHVVDNRIVFRGTFAVYSELDGAHEYAYLNDGEILIVDGDLLIYRSQGRIEGKVENFTKELSTENELDVKISNNPRDVDLEDMVGNYIYVEPAPYDPIPEGVEVDRRYSNKARDRRNGTMRIEGVEINNGNRATIDIGEYTLIRRFSTNDPADGYSYSIEEKAEFVIPLGELTEYSSK